jgi:cyclic pyranopterin phosphate synthase
MQKLIDPFNRNITYLRVSVTDHCNYHCHYCRDEDHVINTTRNEIMSYEEIATVCRLFSELGVTKVRLTGGEPLLRKDILNLATKLGQIPMIDDIPISTNAHLLAPIANQLKAVGINRVNISIDSLDKKRFKQITRGGDLDKVIQGIDAAIAAGMTPIKLNMVVMRGINDDEIEAMVDFVIARNIDIRFIETMPIGAAGIDAVGHHYSESDILKRMHTHLPNRLLATHSKQTAGPAKNYSIKNSRSSVGIISAVSNNFCSNCNRVRLTAKGRLILCLGQENSISLRDAIRTNMSDNEIKSMIISAINNKPERHEFNTNINNINNVQMVEIGG